MKTTSRTRESSDVANDEELLTVCHMLRPRRGCRLSVVAVNKALYRDLCTELQLYSSCKLALQITAIQYTHEMAPAL